MREHVLTPDDQDTVVVPAHPVRSPDAEADGNVAADAVPPSERQLVLETRRSMAGMPCGLAFTSVQRMVSCLTEEQPWVAMPLGAARALYGEAGVRTVAVDPVASDDHTTGGEAERVDSRLRSASCAERRRGSTASPMTLMT